MADERSTRTGRKVPNYGKIPRSKSTGPRPTTGTELEPQTNIPKPTTSKLTAGLNVKEFFLTDDEFSSHESQTSGSERSIEEQKTPKPAKIRKKNTPTPPTEQMEVSDEDIPNLPPPRFHLSTLETGKNSEKKDQHLYSQKITNQSGSSTKGNFHTSNTISTATGSTITGETGQGFSDNTGPTSDPDQKLGPTNQIETRFDNYFWISFTKVKGITVPETHKIIRANFSCIKGFHNAITQ
jgi:hypothetical protein